jgi:hypothetical protein
MPNPILPNSKRTSHAGDAAKLLTIRQDNQRFIAELDPAIERLNAFRIEISAKPKPTLSPLVDGLKAKGWSEAEAADALAHAADKLRCLQCDAITHAACDCGTAYSRAGWRFFAEHPELLKQINGKATNGHDVTKSPTDVTKVPPETKAESHEPMSSAERVRRHRAKLAAERRNGRGLIDELFPKGSPACDFDFEHGTQDGDDDGGAFMRARAVKWQMLEAERLAVECALLRDGTTGAEVKKLHISTALKVARHWVKLANQLRTQRRRP